MPCWTQDQEHRLQVTLSLTGSKIVGLSLSTMLVKGRSRRSAEGPVSFTSKAVIDYNGDGSVTIDVRRALDDKLQAGKRADVATSGRFESRWIVHSTLTDVSWLRDRRGNAYTLNGVDFAKASNYLGDMLTWETNQSGIVWCLQISTWTWTVPQVCPAALAESVFALLQDRCSTTEPHRRNYLHYFAFV